jgi:dTDP-4-dehydrorhamnose reductase
MKLLVFGSTGQVACELHRLVPEATFLSRADADLSDPPSCAAAIEASGANVVINAAAYTAVDRAESDEEAAELVNGDAPAEMARAAARMDIPFLHISTDYVFDGTGTRPWKPDDPTAPLGAYGRSKFAGEQGILSAGGQFVILRTSWVFSAFGSNFVKTIRRLGQTRDSLNVVADQIGGPTAARDIAATLVEMAHQLQAGKGAPGIYHYAGAPDVSWADFAREIYRQAGLATVVNDIPTASYPTPAQRPLNSRMDCSKLETVFGIPRPDWKASLTTVLHDLGDE